MIGRLVAFAASTDLDRSAAFYVDVLGLAARDRNPYALVVDGGGTTLRITLVEAKAEVAYTVLGWQVDDIESTVHDLRGRGVTFHRYEGMEQDEHDTWRAPGGSRIAWFADPDGNTLSLEQPPG